MTPIEANQGANLQGYVQELGEPALQTAKAPHSEVLLPFQTSIAEARLRMIGTAVDVDTGLTTKQERRRARAALAQYSTVISMAACNYLSPQFNMDMDEWDDLNEYVHFIDALDVDPDFIPMYAPHIAEASTAVDHVKFDAIDLAADSVTELIEKELKILHADIVTARNQKSKPYALYEQFRTTKVARSIGKVATNTAAAVLSLGTAKFAGEALDVNESRKFLLSSATALGVFLGGRVILPATVRTMTQNVLGGQLERVLKPITPEVSGELKEKIEELSKADKKKLKRSGRAKLAREIEIEAKVKESLHVNLQADIRDWLTDCRRAKVMPECSELETLVTKVIAEHISHEFNLGRMYEDDDDGLASSLPA